MSLFTERKHWGGWLLAALPTLLLSVVAVRQIQLSQTDNLSPWKGGGFGMFASTDSRAQRYLRVYIQGPERHVELAMPRSLEDIAARTAALPNESALRRMASAVAARERRHERLVTTVSIQVWRTQYEPESLSPSEGMIRELKVDVASD